MAAPIIDNRNRRSRRLVNIIPEITSRTGGLDTSLDAIITAYGTGTYTEGALTRVGGNITLPYLAFINIPGSGAELWELNEGSDAEDGTFVVRPDDFDAETNARVWKRIL